MGDGDSTELPVIASLGEVTVDVSTTENVCRSNKANSLTAKPFEEPDGPPPQKSQSRRKLYTAIAVIAGLMALIALIAVVVMVVVGNSSRQTEGAAPVPPSPIPTQPPIGTPLPPSTPSPTEPPTGSLWGTNTEYAELCATDGRFQYFCNSDCMVNCALLGGQNGLLLETGGWELEYCSSTHENSNYQDSTCCCTEWIPVNEQDDVTVPCHGGASPQDACDTWCKLHDEVLHPGAATDCDPGFLWCKPFGNLGDAEECDMAIECSDTEYCCCDIMV